jgi:hypothetical protein
MLSKIKLARARLTALRLALQSPSAEDIGAALPGLEEAVSCLEAVERDIQEGGSAAFEVRRELVLLKNELRISGRLIEHGVAFCQGWARLLGTGPSYTCDGHTAPDSLGACGGTLSLEG